MGREAAASAAFAERAGAHSKLAEAAAAGSKETARHYQVIRHPRECAVIYTLAMSMRMVA